jgi:hypothetical protein
MRASVFIYFIGSLKDTAIHNYTFYTHNGTREREREADRKYFIAQKLLHFLLWTVKKFI